MIDAKTIEELQGLLAKATLGPWARDPDIETTKILDANRHKLAMLSHTHLYGRRQNDEVAATAALIVAMRNALPALLDLASKTLASAREGEDSPAGILDVQRMLTIHQPTGWLARDIAIASARLQPQVSASGGEVEELCGRLEEHATDWDGRQMPDLEPTKGDPTAGTLRAAVTRIRALSAENERLKTMLTGGNLEIVESEQAWKLRAESSEALVAELREKVERLRKALEPFAEAATKGEIGGYPPNYFVGATEFENARRALCLAIISVKAEPNQ